MTNLILPAGTHAAEIALFSIGHAGECQSDFTGIFASRGLIGSSTYKALQQRQVSQKLDYPNIVIESRCV